MNIGTGGIALAAIALALAASAAPATAGVSEDFAGCDGLMKPKSKDDGMRGTASEPGYSFQGLYGGRNPADATIAACDRALSGGKLLPTQTLRRAHLLRARAAAHFSKGDAASALADLDAAEAAIADRRGEIFFDRSMGTSLDLMRAIALAQSGQGAQAATLAERAALARPYALQIQIAAGAILDAVRGEADPLAASGPLPYEAMLRLAPEAGPAMLSRAVRAGDFAAAVHIADRAALNDPATTARPLGGPDPIGQMLARERDTLVALLSSLDLAYALATVGRTEEARERVEGARAAVAAFGVPATNGAEAGGTPGGALAALFGPRIDLADARIALAEGRVDTARRMIGGTLPVSAAAVELFEAVGRADDSAPPQGLAMLRERLAAERQDTGNLGQLASGLLIAPESPRSVIDYQKSRPNILGALVGAALSMGTSLLSGVPKTAGFKETAGEDGTVTVEYTGNTTSAPMVQEMTLLRAAELAREQGKPGFAIAARRDFTRYLTQTQYGAMIRRTPTGHKTELTIRLIGSEEEARAEGFDAMAVIDALGPLYYEKS